MFKHKKNPLDIDTEIARVHTAIEAMKPTDADYAETVDQLAKLYKMKESLKDPSSRMSKDALIAALASVGSVGIIVLFEAVGRGILTTKSLGFAPKPKNKSN